MRTLCPETAFYKGIIDGLNQIDGPGALRKNGLSLSDYYILRDVLHDAMTQGKTETMIQNVASWCGKHGFTVTSTINGYKIQLPDTEPLAKLN